MKHGLVGAALCLVVAGCSTETEGLQAEVGTGASDATKVAPVIVGSVNWQEVGGLAVNNPYRVAARPVALLMIPARGTRCTAFLISADVLMTNNHCIASSSQARNAYAIFDAEAGVPDSLRDTYDCSEFVGADADLDFALVRCQGRPGDQHGVAELGEDMPATNASIYVIHQNCDYYSNPSCAPDKKVSPGAIVSTTATDLQHDADTLGGSSGSALFDENGRVVGLHHLGYGGNSSGRGSYNGAVKMSLVLDAVRSRYASVFDTMPAGGTEPPPATDPVQPPADPTQDRLEPNNDGGTATVLTSRPTYHDGLYVAGGDRDIFSFTLSRRTTITTDIQFSHAAGDLDLYVYQSGVSSPVARSEGVSDIESIRTTLRAGTYFIMVVGYNGATGGYGFSFR